MDHIRNLINKLTVNTVNTVDTVEKTINTVDTVEPSDVKAYRSVVSANVVDAKKINNEVESSTLFRAIARQNKIVSKFTETNSNQILIQTGSKGLHDSVYVAYSQHIPFGLRPDHVWIAIMQSLSRHIELNPDKFKHFFTDSDEKKKLHVEIGLEQFDMFIDDMAKQLTASIKFDPNVTLSTFTPVSLAVSKVALMSLCNSYFDYSCSTLCGIPSINVYGTVADWNNIIEKVKMFGSMFDLADWTNTLVEVLTKIRDCDSNDTTFWSNIYKKNGGSGGPYISGWIMAFYLYSKHNEMFNWRPNMKNTDFGYGGGYSSGNMPTEIFEVPYTYNELGNLRDMKLYAGFCGVVQDKTTGEVQPCVGWAAADVVEEPKTDRMSRFGRFYQDC